MEMIAEQGQPSEGKENKDTMSVRSESGISELRRSDRKTEMTERGKEYWKTVQFNRIKQTIRTMNTLQNQIRQEMSKDCDQEIVRKSYKDWLKVYDNLYVARDKYIGMLNEEQLEEFEVGLWTETVSEASYLKSQVENWFAKESSKHASSMSGRSKGSSKLSQLSSARIKEKQALAELEAEGESLKKKHDLKIAQLKLKLQEEELDLQTKISIVEAKTRIIEEEMENASKENMSSNKSDIHTRIKKDFNPFADPFVPTDHRITFQVPTYEDHVPRQDVKNKVHDWAMRGLPALRNEEQPQVGNSEEVFMHMVKQMRKPPPDITPFDGNPLQYRKFLRQFKSKIVINSEDDDERMNYLEQFTVGPAHQIVSGYSYLDSQHGYPAALHELEERYGNDEVIANAFIERAANRKPIKPDDPVALDQFSIFITECENAVKSIRAVQILENSNHLKQLVMKLPFHHHDKWRTIIERKRLAKSPVTFKDFADFVRTEARKVNDPVFGRTAMRFPLAPVTQPKLKNSSYKPGQQTGMRFSSHATQVQMNKSSIPQDTRNHTNVEVHPCLYCGSSKHETVKCVKLLALSVHDRLEFFKSKEVCFKCLNPGHKSIGCLFNISCEHCHGRHQTILHLDRRLPQHTLPRMIGRDEPQKIASCCSDLQECLGCQAEVSGQCAMAIIPVKVKMPNSCHVVETYAFMDPGSSASFCSEKLMRSLGAEGMKKRITLETMGNTHVMSTYEVKNIEVCDLDMKNKVILPSLFSKDKMPVSTSHIPTNQDIKKWNHLQDIDLPQIDTDIGLLIGNNIPEAYSPLAVRCGPRGSPHATQTALGWIVWNVLRGHDEEKVEGHAVYYVNRIDIQSVQEIEEERRLDQLVRKAESFDFPESILDEEKALSQEDEKFLNMVEETIELKDGHYYIDLPFRQEEVELPDNHLQALQRFMKLKEKMTRNPQFAADYDEFMTKMISKGYAEKVPEGEREQEAGKTWYIPHHGVYNPRKPGKIRVVFDCTAKFQGVSLNSQLLSGPNLTNSLLGVLMRFRQESFAVMGDIEAMFLQVRVPVCSRDFLRFYWWADSDKTKDPAIFRMTAHLFGSVSSPACANSALLRTAQDNEALSTVEAVEVIRRNFYVDDCLKSVKSEELAIKLIQDVSSLCLKGGFRLSKWVSNSPIVMNSVPHEERAKGLQNLDLEESKMPSERALGIHWEIETDILGFKVCMKEGAETRRNILSVVSSVFDPLGFLSPFVLRAKILLQDLCRKDLGWDQVIEGKDLQRWQQWAAELPMIENVKVPRCHKPNDFGKVLDYQIHLFADASQAGYGVVAYLRLENKVGQVHCSFLLSKSRVVPLKKVTIPRLELTAATAAARLSRVIVNNLDYPIDKVIFWTDSMSVLRYLWNEKTRFQTFVANRIAKIRAASDVKQWKYVSSKDNPADAASRGMTVNQLLTSETWLKGPSILWQDESCWPQIPDSARCTMEEDPEVKRNVSSTIVSGASSVLEKLGTYYSSWSRLKRGVAWLMLTFQVLRSKSNKGRQAEKDKVTPKLTVEVLKGAETKMFQLVQQEHFKNDFKTDFSDGRKAELSVKRSSKLCKFDPMIRDGVIRIGGRLERANIPFENKHQIILPKNSPVSRLIVQEAHKVVGHMGKNAMLSHVRQSCWILGAGQMCKSVIAKCVTCKRYRAGMCNQKMADLPKERLQYDVPPFTHVGMDYFGPFHVKRGRSLVKRYGVIFTCLAIRAIHLEVASSLDTDSCINAVRRFIARRGQPQSILSDNGTNLVGCANELRESLKALNQERLHSTLLQRGINWLFNTPTASHQGGVWERMIRTVRKVLYSIMKDQPVNLDDEGLNTLMCEVETIVNNRPLTEMPDVADLSPLTPNHLLTQHACGNTQPGVFDSDDQYKRRWRHIQYVADTFWRRWRKEYLPLLQTRQKWHHKKDNLAVGDVVLLMDPSPRNAWSMGRVLSVFTDKKGCVRTVRVKTSTTELVRPVTKIVLLCADR